MRRPAEVFPPGEFLREELEARGWTQTDFAEIIERPVRTVNEIIAGKRSITAETAEQIATALGTSAQLWLNLETAFQLSQTKNPNADEIRRRARLYEIAPINEMVRRGWIRPSNNVAVMERQILDFFEISSLDDEPEC
ncbi:MAG TPA: HigA family addiction module antitoxin, partial [Chloroflexota bacterium]|nr:HigA family addiction module antitoxin [Chloroflexota bacterium]